jgi:hypothetical protein
MSGKKKFITRKIKPFTWKKYLVINKKKRWFDLIDYDALRLSFGIGSEPKTMLVKIIDKRLIIMVDEDNQPAYYEYKGKKYSMFEVDYFLGEILEYSTD